MYLMKGLRKLTIGTQLSSQSNFSQRKIKLSRTKLVSSLGPRLWDNILTPGQKKCTTQNYFRKSVKETLYAKSLIIFEHTLMNSLAKEST